MSTIIEWLIIAFAVMLAFLLRGRLWRFVVLVFTSQFEELLNLICLIPGMMLGAFAWLMVFAPVVLLLDGHVPNLVYLLPLLGGLVICSVAGGLRSADWLRPRIVRLLHKARIRIIEFPDEPVPQDQTLLPPQKPQVNAPVPKTAPNRRLTGRVSALKDDIGCLLFFGLPITGGVFVSLKFGSDFWGAVTMFLMLASISAFYSLRNETGSKTSTLVFTFVLWGAVSAIFLAQYLPDRVWDGIFFVFALALLAILLMQRRIVAVRLKNVVRLVWCSLLNSWTQLRGLMKLHNPK